jgi:hypothetical protein
MEGDGEKLPDLGEVRSDLFKLAPFGQFRVSLALPTGEVRSDLFKLAPFGQFRVSLALTIRPWAGHLAPRAGSAG